uniref:Carbonyl reductase 1 n=1 Tax=Ursus americanus TaxID=9643 RepID=A0A452Q8C2_URSAM
MSSAPRVALVTGANKGIGFAITRDLCRQFSGDVVLTARDEARGRAAVQQLQAEGLSPRFHRLDIEDLQSIRVLRDFLRKEYGGLDVLVNNAGVAFDIGDPTPLHIQAEVTMKTNFFGTQAVCTELLPLMKPQEVIMLTSLLHRVALWALSPRLSSIPALQHTRLSFLDHCNLPKRPCFFSLFLSGHSLCSLRACLLPKSFRSKAQALGITCRHLCHQTCQTPGPSTPLPLQ